MSKLYVLNGPEIGDVFEIKEGVSYLGRAEDNDIRITDKTVSRKHLRIERKGERCFITDLESRNGTYRDGKYLVPGVETEIREGVPVAIGMSVIGVGKGCLEYLVPFLDLIALIRDPGDQLGIWGDQREGTDQKVLELLYRVSDLLKKDSPIRETAGEILRHLFDFLKRVDRGAFILLESGTGDIKEIIFKSRRSSDDSRTSFCRDVVKRVIERRTPVIVLDAGAEEDEGLADTLEILGIKSVMCVPLISASQVEGAIYVDSLQRPYGFRKDDLCLIMDLSQRTAMAVEHARLSETLSKAVDALISSE